MKNYLYFNIHNNFLILVLKNVLIIKTLINKVEIVNKEFSLSRFLKRCGFL